MRKRDAFRIARRFVAQKYPALVGCYMELALEHDGERRKNWSFGVHFDEEEDPKRYEMYGDRGLVGYVHDCNPFNDGPAVEGLY